MPALPETFATTRQTASRRIACPRCTAPMHSLQLSSHKRAPVTVDHCPDCRLVWFDQFESVQLDGFGWVRLLREMEQGAKRPLAEARIARPSCPACAEPLKSVQNRTRFGLFAALECPSRHGHLHSHSGLLAERGLVRPLGMAERRALAQEKHRLHCFNCGGPAASTDNHCSYCGTALVVLDLPRLAHSLRLRFDGMGASPQAMGHHTAWACRACGGALDPGRETSCSHCGHLVVAFDLPDIEPLLDAAEAEHLAAADVDAQRLARFPSTRRAAAPAIAPSRLVRQEPPAPATTSWTRTLMLAGWLPLLVLLVGALALAVLGPPRGSIALPALLGAFVAYCAAARLFGERRATNATLVIAALASYLLGRGEGAASVLTIGMFFGVALILSLIFTFAFRIYRDAVFRRFG